MRLRSLFRRKPLPPGPVAASPSAAVGRDGPPSPDELSAAWAELSEAAKGSKVTRFHASTAGGQSWTDDPAAVRDVAATLREFPAQDNQQTT